MNPLVSLVVTKVLEWLLARLGEWYDKTEKKLEARKETGKAIDNAEKHNDTSGIFKP